MRLPTDVNLLAVRHWDSRLPVSPSKLEHNKFHVTPTNYVAEPENNNGERTALNLNQTEEEFEYFGKHVM